LQHLPYCLKYDGKEYYTYSNGTVAVNTQIGDKYVGADGVAVAGMKGKAQAYSSDTNYLILINTSTHKIGVYKGSKGKWVERTYESCADGNSSHRTPKGTFTTKHSMQYEDSSAGRHWYVTDFGSSSIWSVPYVKGTDQVADGTRGKAVDVAGCVRVTRDTAEWIYDAIPNGTKVVVY
jgi:lipoprotein-anchoring transpeptidase ErfK/SrfK